MICTLHCIQYCFHYQALAYTRQAETLVSSARVPALQAQSRQTRVLHGGELPTGGSKPRWHQRLTSWQFLCSSRAFFKNKNKTRTTMFSPDKQQFIASSNWPTIPSLPANMPQILSVVDDGICSPVPLDGSKRESYCQRRACEGSRGQ